MPVVAIDRIKGTRKMFTCSNELAEEITAWRTAQRPIPSESAAVAMLLWQALLRWREQQESEDQTKGHRS
jgi:hypothetical protein